MKVERNGDYLTLTDEDGDRLVISGGSHAVCPPGTVALVTTGMAVLLDADGAQALIDHCQQLIAAEEPKQR